MTKATSVQLQKLYDDVHLVCSTAVYFEGRADENEALRCWKNALDQIAYNRLYRVPQSYRPKTESEKALLASIRQLELQCKERIDLIEALRESRKEAGGDKAVANAENKEGWLGDGTISTLTYSDLARPPALPTRPLPPRTISGESISRNLQPSSSKDPGSRTPSPEKQQSKFRSTLRGGDGHKTKATRLSHRPPAASKAASQAWLAKPIIKNLSPNNAAATRDTALKVARMSMGNERGNERGSGRPAPKNPFADFDGSYGSADEERRNNSIDGRGRLNNEKRNRKSEGDLYPLSDSTSYNSPRLAGKVKERSSAGSNTSPRIKSSPAPPPPPRHRYIPDQSQKQTTNIVKPIPKPPPVRSTQLSSPGVRRKPIQKTSSTWAESNPKASSSSQPQPMKTPNSKSEIPFSSTDDYDSFPSNEEDEDEDEDEEEEDEEDEEEEVERYIDPSLNWRAFSAQVLANIPRGIDQTAATQILNDIIIQGDHVTWQDIAGLDVAKSALKENVVYPFLRPDLFRGLREPARGMLLFGPPGTGKTMLARAVATESQSTFFAISASSLVSKFLGESEKLVRALFALAKMLAPSIIFVDEIDSLLSSRDSSGEHEASRRIKTEFLIQWSDLARAAAGRETLVSSNGPISSNAVQGDASRVLVLAATNAPWAIDEAARRRFVRRQYIPLPEDHVRKEQLLTLLAHQKQSLSDSEVDELVTMTEGFSGSDITALAKDAAMGPLRSLGDQLLSTKTEDIRPIGFEDFKASLMTIRPSVSKTGLQQFEDWANDYGERGG